MKFSRKEKRKKKKKSRFVLVVCNPVPQSCSHIVRFDELVRRTQTDNSKSVSLCFLSRSTCLVSGPCACLSGVYMSGCARLSHTAVRDGDRTLAVLCQDAQNKCDKALTEARDHRSQ
jgi:hypothetical protein